MRRRRAPHSPLPPLSHRTPTPGREGVGKSKTNFFFCSLPPLPGWVGVRWERRAGVVRGPDGADSAPIIGLGGIGDLGKDRDSPCYNIFPMATQPIILRPPVQTSPEPAELEVSVLIPVIDEAGTVEELAQRVAAVLEREGRSFEIIFIDDGSRDGTPARVRAARERDPRVKLVRLRRNFGKAAALSAGFDHSIGRIVITMDGDLQDDPDEIPRFLSTLEEQDLDLVSGWKRRRQDPVSKTWPSRLFNWV